MRIIKSVGFIALLSGAFCLSGCTVAHNNSSPRSYATTALSEMSHNSGGSVLFTPQTLTSALPSTTYYDGAYDIRASTLVSTGHFTGWKPASLPRDSEQPPEGQNAAAGPYKIIILTYQVDAVISRGPQASGVKPLDQLPVDVYLGQKADSEKFGEGMTSLGNVVTFLSGGFKGSKYWDISGGGALIGSLETTGKFKMLVDVATDGASETAAGIKVDADSVDQLIAAAAIPRRILVGPAAEGQTASPSPSSD